MATSHTTTVPWAKEEIDHFVAWMEDNPDDLKGKQAAWHKVVKNEAFARDEHIAVKKDL